MSKLKPSPIEAASETVIRNICAQGAINGCKTDTEIAKKIGMSRTLFSVRKRNPRLLRLEEIIMASMSLKCSLAWLVTDHKGEYKYEP